MSCTSGTEPVVATPPSHSEAVTVDVPPPRFPDAFTVEVNEDSREAVLRFEPGSALHESRAGAWLVEAWDGQVWNIEWVIGEDFYTIQEWTDSSLAVGDAGYMGPGPVALPLPELQAGTIYRICNGSPSDTETVSCSSLVIGN